MHSGHKRVDLETEAVEPEARVAGKQQEQQPSTDIPLDNKEDMEDAVIESGVRSANLANTGLLHTDTKRPIRFSIL